MLGASGGEGGGGNEETANSQTLSDLQSENRELRKKLETLEEEKEKALEKARDDAREFERKKLAVREEKQETNSQALSDLQFENRELRKRIEDKENVPEAGLEIDKLRREVETLKFVIRTQHEMLRKTFSGGVDIR